MPLQAGVVLIGPSLLPGGTTHTGSSTCVLFAHPKEKTGRWPSHLTAAPGSCHPLSPRGEQTQLWVAATMGGGFQLYVVVCESLLCIKTFILPCSPQKGLFLN